jgi:4-hydroxy-2,2'-bipyrrole-5-carbaldehyde O-methyltransferase
MNLSRAQIAGVFHTIRAGNATARALAITDSRAVVRSLFLSSAIRAGLIDDLNHGVTFAEIAAKTASVRRERLQAWLDIGSELGEITQRRGHYRIGGRRARAIAAGDVVLRAHYRSILDYQVGPYAELDALLRSEPGHGRTDLDQYADDIAQVSQAATPFIASYLAAVIGETQPGRILDVGCGTAIYSRIAAGTAPQVLIDGIDLAEAVIDAARLEVQLAGLGERIRLYAGDIRRWTPEPGIRYDLILLLNNIYYFPREERVPLYRQLGGMLSDRGRLVVTSLTAPGSVAAAHLNFMLTCQTGAAALPRPGELETDLSRAGLRSIRTQRLVPTEPFLAAIATRS